MSDHARAVLEGLGVAAPARVVTNADLEAVLDTTDEWIRTRTGIRERRIADPGTATADLAVEAGARALKSAGEVDVDTVIVATTTPDRIIPNTAPEVASRLGLGHAAAFDVNAACSGFVYGLAVAEGMLATGVSRRVLMVGSETISRYMDPTDRTTAVLFGDGAGAAVLRPGEAGELGVVGPFDLGSDGDRADLLAIEAGGSRLRATSPDLPRSAHYLQMDGREVYRQAVARMATSCRLALQRAGLDVDAVDRLVAHQANIRILEAVADRLRLPRERCYANIARYGNTSAASIPLALADAGLSPGERVIVTAFGGGLTWGSGLIVWPELTVV